MARSNITWYHASKVFCDCRFVFSVGSTKAKISVDYWSGLCVFYLDLVLGRSLDTTVEDFVGRYSFLSFD